MRIDPQVPRYYVLAQVGESGPFTASALREALDNQEIQASDQVRTGQGTSLGTVAEVLLGLRANNHADDRSGLTDVTGNQTAVGHAAIRHGIRRFWIPVSVISILLLVVLVILANRDEAAPPSSPPPDRPAAPTAVAYPRPVQSPENSRPDDAAPRPVPTSMPGMQTQVAASDLIAIEDFHGTCRGWAGPWSQPQPIIQQGDLSGGCGWTGQWLASSIGNLASVRRLAQPIDRGVFWLAFRMRLGNPAGIGGLLLMAGQEQVLLIGTTHFQLRWQVQALFRTGTRESREDTVTIKPTRDRVNKPALLVVRCAIQDDRYIVTLWVDPALDREPPSETGRHLTIRSPFSCDGIAVFVNKPKDFIEVGDLHCGRTWKGLFKP